MTLPVEISSLSKRLAGRDILKNVDLRLPAGRSIALVGHNGAGKTSLIKMILGLSRPTGGAIRVFGEDPSHGHTRGQIGFLPENVSFSPALTGREILTYYARLKGVRPAEESALLERVGLSKAACDFIHTYSKGMRQRLGLAQALIGAPRLLLLDEPTTGLDAAVRQTFYEIIATLRARGVAVLLSSHSLTELENQLDRIIVMRRGSVVADGSVDELMELAALPLRFAVKTRKGAVIDKERLGPVEELRVYDNRMEFLCSRKDKMGVLHAILQNHTTIEDVGLFPPTLDQLYSHFLPQGDDAC
ncbi:ABC transporter ATP-binding protein [Methylocystis sp. IM3]|uniref:ABC transporter ATP-binding protein n=1 Tax=unclassified Methylocystis TaxID=2625913 RepID=UPI0030FA8A22